MRAESRRGPGARLRCKVRRCYGNKDAISQHPKPLSSHRGTIVRVLWKQTSPLTLRVRGGGVPTPKFLALEYRRQIQLSSQSRPVCLMLRTHTHKIRSHTGRYDHLRDTLVLPVSGENVRGKAGDYDGDKCAIIFDQRLIPTKTVCVPQAYVFHSLTKPDATHHACVHSQSSRARTPVSTRKLVSSTH